jgi:Fe-S-cluster containining protein
MTEPDGVLEHHQLIHLGKLRVDPHLFHSRYPGTCATSRCKGRCCVNGVWTDLTERDRILAHADMIRSHMDADQEHDPDRWFGETRDDADFPSRRAIATALWSDGCVFLTRAGRCVLQKASESQPERGVDLKPFFCRAFPITIDAGQLEIGEGYDQACCIPTPDGSLDVFEVCSTELTYVLGEQGHQELEQLAAARARKDGSSSD